MSHGRLRKHPHYTRMLATIRMKDGIYAIRVELSDDDHGSVAWAEQTSVSIDLASALIIAVAQRFSIEPDKVEIAIEAQPRARERRTMH